MIEPNRICNTLNRSMLEAMFEIQGDQITIGTVATVHTPIVLGHPIQVMQNPRNNFQLDKEQRKRNGQRKTQPLEAIYDTIF